MSYKVKYGNTEITFSLDKRDRKTLAIHVYPDQHVEVVAPEDAGLEKILQKVRKRAPWIVKQKLEFSRIQPPQPKPKFITGETFRYLGKQYRLVVKESRSPSAKLRNGRFVMSVPPGTNATKREFLLLNWFRERGRKIFHERFLDCITRASVLGITEVPGWQIKVMEKRWGSCTKTGKIYLNPELVAAPKLSIDYVIFHELCHLIEHNHSRRFFELLSKVYPDWKRWRDHLNENIEVRLV